MIAQSGASPKVAQELARHSTVTLTLGRYAHAALYDLAAAVSDLPSILPPEGPSNANLDALRVTGTDGRGENPARHSREPKTGAKNLSPNLGPQPAKTGDCQRQTEAQIRPVNAAPSSANSSGNHGKSRILKGVPKVGLEPTRPLGTPDFESGASANSATSALLSDKELRHSGHSRFGACAISVTFRPALPG